MTTPEARNQLEKLDILLSKVDAVRFALPEIVDFFTGSTARTSSVPQDPQTSVLEYRDRVKKAERSIAELQTGAVALGDTLLKLQARADSLNIGKKATVSRQRKNPYSGRFQFTAFSPAPVKDYIRYPSPSEEDISVTSSDSLNAALRQYLTGYQDLSLRSACEPWGKGSIAIELVDQAVFHVFLSWEPSGKPVFLRINVLGQGEKRQPFQLSEYTIWVNASVHASQAVLRHSDQDGLNIPCLLSLIQSYSNAYGVYCQGCASILHRETLQLPVARLYQAGTTERSRDSWQVYHKECLPSRSVNTSAAV